MKPSTLNRRRFAHPTIVITCLASLAIPGLGFGQSTDEAERLPSVTVVAQKESEAALTSPVSVTAVVKETIKDADVNLVKDASIYAPNVFINEFSARKLSNPTFRGVGASPANPGVTTYIDGVPQLNANISSMELIDVDQVEFVRGPQGALYGRNTVGGLIHVLSRRPADHWMADAEASYGNYEYRDFRATASGPIVADQWGLSLGGGYSARNGFTENTLTGNDLDHREAFFGKGQLMFQASEQFEVRLILSGESADDGDYALADLAAIRSTPYRVMRDYEGFTRRDIFAPTLLATYRGEVIEVNSISGLVCWETHDSTDLDYTPFPLVTRDNQEEAHQFTQEFRFANAKERPITFSDDLEMAWQSGVFFFTQNYQQDTANTLSPLVTSLPFSLRNETRGELDDMGVGLYGQVKLTAWEKLDIIAGLRLDYEDKEADLNSFTTPPGPGPSTEYGDDFTELSPHFGLTYHITENQIAYGSVTRGFKSGGFNTTAPPANNIYSEESTWSYEIGHKAGWFDSKVETTVALFYIDWEDMQLNDIFAPAPGVFLPYIRNAGGATSKGIEFEARYRPISAWDLFGSVGYTDAEFRSGSMDNGVSVAGNRLPQTPDFTLNLGTQFAWEICEHATVYARAEATTYGNLFFDAANGASQDTYTLANFRAGVRGQHWFVEGWARNAFDETYVSTALAFTPAFAPSGYIGELGAPVTFGVRAGLSF